jgi:hypothetical protein
MFILIIYLILFQQNTALAQSSISIYSDSSWLTNGQYIDGWNSLDFEDSSWWSVKVIGTPPVGPWRDISNMDGTNAQWIWYLDGTINVDRFFRKTFIIDQQIISAILKITADNNYYVYVNGNFVGKDTTWESAEIYDISKYLQQGKNVIAVKASDSGNPAGLLVEAEIKKSSSSTEPIKASTVSVQASISPISIYSDSSWLTNGQYVDGWNSLGLEDSSWWNVKVLGTPPVGPWRDISNMEGTNAQWIWYLDGTINVDRFFRKTFTIDLQIISAIIKITADNEYYVYVNGNFVGKDTTWEAAEIYDISKYLQQGKNVIAVKALDSGNSAGLLVEAEIKTSSSSIKYIQASIVSITKSASPYSLRQFQESTIKVLIENSGTSEVKAIEIMDSIHPGFDLTGGAFTLDPATVTYADSEGNIHEVRSEPVSVKVVPSSEGSASGASSGQPSGQSSRSASVSLTGEKTDVVLGEDILLKLSAVNLITKPKMHVQVIIIPPSGMSVTSSEFSKSGTNQFTANYELEPGDGKDIEVRIKPNQIGDFNVNGRIIYYFGDDKVNAEDHTLPLPIKVRKEPGQTMPSSANDGRPASKISGFAGELTIFEILLIALLIKRKG